jgi:hypothetical protein
MNKKIRNCPRDFPFHHCHALSLKTTLIKNFQNQNILTRFKFFSKIFPRPKNFYKKNFSGIFSGRQNENIRNVTPMFHANIPQKNHPPGTPFFAIHTTPNPATLRAPIPGNIQTEPYTRPDWDRSTPYLAQKSWIF